MASAGRQTRVAIARPPRIRPAALAPATALTLLITVAFIGTSGSVAQDQVIRFGASLSLTGRFVDNARLAKDGYDFYASRSISVAASMSAPGGPGGQGRRGARPLPGAVRPATVSRWRRRCVKAAL